MDYKLYIDIHFFLECFYNSKALWTSIWTGMNTNSYVVNYNGAIQWIHSINRVITHLKYTINFLMVNMFRQPQDAIFSTEWIGGNKIQLDISKAMNKLFTSVVWKRSNYNNNIFTWSWSIYKLNMVLKWWIWTLRSGFCLFMCRASLILREKVEWAESMIEKQECENWLWQEGNVWRCL